MKALLWLAAIPVAFGVWVLVSWMFRPWPPDWEERKAAQEDSDGT